MFYLQSIQTIDSASKKEECNIMVFKERSDLNRQITNNMVNILESFEDRLSKLEETILPLYMETENRQLRQRNIERTLSALEDLIGYYNVSTDVEAIIRAGPTSSHGLDTFLNALDKLKQAQTYFEKSNAQSVELENVSSLFNYGGDTLNRVFQEILSKHNKDVPPITILDWIANDEDLSADDSSSVSSYSHFPEAVASDLIRIANWLNNESRDEYMNVYARMRATIVTKSLNMLKDHQRSASGSSIQGKTVTAIAASPTVRQKHQNRLEPPTSKRTKRIQNLFEKKAKGMLLSIEHSTGFSLGSRRSAAYSIEGREDVTDEQEVENYLMMVMAVQKLMYNELALLSGIIPSQHQHQVFQIIIQNALCTVVQDGELIASRAKRCVNRHDFSSALVIFPMLKHLLLLKPEFDRTVESCDYNVRTQFSNITNSLQMTGSKILEDFVDHIKSDSNTSLPSDGTVYQLTSDVLFISEQLLDFIDIIGSVLVLDSSYSNAVASLPMDLKHSPANKNRVLLSLYIKKVLSQLNLTLVNKSDVYSDVGVRVLFKLNNFNYILKSLQRCALLQIVSVSEPECEETYYKMISTQKKQYLQCWNKVLSYITAVDDIQLYYGKLKDKERNLLKERFSGFNKEIEEISKLQRGYSVPDFELREGLKRDNKEFILPKYHSFYDKYANLPFARNVAKYVKYTPAEIAAMMDRFFDIAA